MELTSVEVNANYVLYESIPGESHSEKMENHNYAELTMSLGEGIAVGSDDVNEQGSSVSSKVVLTKKRVYLPYFPTSYYSHTHLLPLSPSSAHSQ